MTSVFFIRVWSVVHTNDDSDNGERDCISPLLESSFDELSLVEDSSLSSSPLTLSLHSDEYVHTCNHARSI